MEKNKGCLWAGVCLGVLAYLVLVVLSVLHLPMSLFLRMLPPIVVVGLLLRKTPTWVKGVVGAWLVVVAVYVLFNNDILGPIGFAIRDRPIDTPAQFYHSWRYFWTMCYLYEVSWTWGVPSMIFLIGYKVWQKISSQGL